MKTSCRPMRRSTQGNSGGALVNTAGELVGINSQILSPSGGNIGIGFAVPSNMAKNVMDQLVANGRVHRGLLGVTVQGMTGELAAGLGLNKTEGALVSGVTPGGAAEKAGIKRGDVILGYQGRPVIDTNSFRNEIAATKPGTTITLQVLRDGKTSEMKATLAENDAAKDARRGSEDREGEGASKYGMTVEPITPEIARAARARSRRQGRRDHGRRPVRRGGIRRPAGRRRDPAGQRQVGPHGGRGAKRPERQHGRQAVGPADRARQRHGLRPAARAVNVTRLTSNPGFVAVLPAWQKLR